MKRRGTKSNGKTTRTSKRKTTKMSNDELQCSVDPAYMAEIGKLSKKYKSDYIVAAAKKMSLAQLEKKANELYQAYRKCKEVGYNSFNLQDDKESEDYETWKSVDHCVINQLLQVNSEYEDRTGKRLIPKSKFPYPQKRLPAKGTKRSRK